MNQRRLPLAEQHVLQSGDGQKVVFGVHIMASDQDIRLTRGRKARLSAIPLCDGLAYRPRVKQEVSLAFRPRVKQGGQIFRSIVIPSGRVASSTLTV